MKNLGFEMMRLSPVSGPTYFDYDQLNQMVAADGTDITETVEKAVTWLAEHSF